MNAATIGSALIAKRQELGIDKGQAADKIGMSRTTYSSYEQDSQRPSVDVFPALAEFLNVSIEDFLLLYGATAIVAVRPALERVLLTHEDSMTVIDAPAASSPTDDESEVVAPAAWSLTDDEFEVIAPAVSSPTDDESESNVASVAPFAVVGSKKKAKDKKKKKKSDKK
jgi:transcriptional regulator with XRE-family HTH domain